ncbi:MAG: PAS domain S-box protein [Chloroflexota bacterium]
MKIKRVAKGKTDQSLSDAEARYRLLAENISETVWLMDMELRTLYASPSVTRLRDYSLDELNALPFGQQMTPESLERVMVLFAEALSSENLQRDEPRLAYTIELEFYRKDGSRFWSENTLTLILDENKQPVNILGRAADITDRKRAEEALRRSEARYHMLFNLMDEGVAINQAVLDENGDMVDYIVLEMNPAFERHTPYKASDAAGKRATDLYQMSPEYIRDWWRTHAPLDQVVYTEMYHQSTGQWFTITTTPREGDYFITIFRNITPRKQVEAERRQREREFRTLVENAPDAIVRFDRQYRHLYANPAVEKEFGVSPQDLLGKTHRELGQPSAMADWSEGVIRQVFETGQEVVFELENPGIDGPHYFLSRGVPEFAPDGSVESALFIHRSIDARKRAEAALAASEHKYRSLFSEMVSGSALHEIVCDKAGKPVDYVTLEVNRSYESLLGAKAEDVIGKLASEILPPDELEKWLGIFAPVALTGISTHYEMYSPFNRKYFEGNAYCPEKGRFAVTFTDVTERRQAEADLRSSEEKFYKAFHTSPVVMSITTLADGRFIDANPQFCKMAGWLPEEVIGRTANELGLWGDEQQRHSIVAEIRQQGFVHAKEVQMFTRSGQAVPLLWYGDVIQLGDQPCILASGYDLTEIKHAEQKLRSALDEKEILLRELYHRTKNNMQVISSLLSLEAGRSQDETLRKALREMDNRIRAMSLVHQKLYQSGNLSSINLGEYFSDLVSALIRAYQIAPGRVIFKQELEPIPALIDIAIPCGLIFSEIVSNIFKHAFPGGRSGEVRIRLARLETGAILLEVTDDGVGLPPGMDLRTQDSLGAQIAFGIAESQLKAQVQVESIRGVSWRIQFLDDLYRPRV